MVNSTTVSIAVIGGGYIGPRHAKSAIQCKETKLLCIVDPAPQNAALAKSFDVKAYASITDMLQDDCKPDAAVVCTPNRTHVEIAQELLSAGIHVLVEKPISTTISTGRDLVQSARVSGKQLLVGHHRRFNPYVTATKQALSEGEIGRPIAVSGLWVTYKPVNYFEGQTKWRAIAGDGGPILLNMIHEIDILQYLLGPIVKVHAERTLSQRGHEAEEGAAILFRFKSGVVGTFILSDSCPSAHLFESSGENPTIPQSNKDFYRIFGTEGTLSVGDMILSKYTTGVEKSWSSPLKETVLPVGDQVPFDEQMKHLASVASGEAATKCSGEDGLSALIVCDAIRRAIEDGESVVIDASNHA